MPRGNGDNSHLLRATNFPHNDFYELRAPNLTEGPLFAQVCLAEATESDHNLGADLKLLASSRHLTWLTQLLLPCQKGLLASPAYTWKELFSLRHWRFLHLHLVSKICYNPKVQSILEVIEIILTISKQPQ